jgi:light-regulated signal transduction histidine kinase (bacteriophytochrome)
VRSASCRKSELIDGMQAWSCLARAELAAMPLDLTAMGREIAGELKARGVAREGAISIASGMRATGAPRRLRIVFGKLIGNALPCYGKRPASLTEAGTMRQHGEQVHFVRRNGLGFDREYADKLLAVLRRRHSERDCPGHGAGHGAVQRVVRRHGGRVWANSLRGQGAVFPFTLGSTVVNALTAAKVR